MNDLILIALAGFFASMVDGALGMGFGPTSASILLSTGLSPAATSAMVNMAKVATGLVAAVAHWRFDNIDRSMVLKLAIPGAFGAVIGTTVLATVDGAAVRPYLALVLLAIGFRILLRFSRPLPPHATSQGSGERGSAAFEARGVEVAGAVGGMTNGLVGAWGPVVTPFLLHRGVPPRYAVGTVNTAEVAVAVVSVGSLFATLGGKGIEIGVALAMLGGGVVAAPLAAYVVRFIPARGLGLAVAGLLFLTQTRELAGADLLPADRWVFYALIPAAIGAAALRPHLAPSARLPRVGVVDERSDLDR